MSLTGDCKAYTAVFHDWPAAVLENDIVRLVAIPDIGGRVMALDLGPYAYFFVDPDLAGKLFTAEENQGDGSLAAWKNYGGDKTWPAPQGWDNDQQWHGPPDPVLDSGRYTLDVLQSDGDRAVLRMVSPADPVTGVQIARQFELRRGSSQVAVLLTFTNVKESPIRWSIWDVVQLRAEREVDGRVQPDPSCIVTAPLNPQSRFAGGYNVMFGEEDNPQWSVDHDRDLFIARYQWEIGKVALDSLGGWIAFNQGTDGYAFVERFAVEPDADYPDDGATIECWTVGAGQVANLDYSATSIYLMETEVLGPLRTIQPGEATSFSLTWDACLCPGPIVDVADAGCVAVPLQAIVLDDDFVRLRGQFGVNAAGYLSLVWLGSQDGQFETMSLGAVDPLTAVLLDRVVPIPMGAIGAELRVTAVADRVDRLLARIAL